MRISASRVARQDSTYHSSTCFGAYDYTLPLTLYNTEARVQEILDLQLERPLQALPHGGGGNPSWYPVWPEAIWRVLQVQFSDARSLDSGSAPTVPRAERPAADVLRRAISSQDRLRRG